MKENFSKMETKYNKMKEGQAFSFSNELSRMRVFWGKRNISWNRAIVMIFYNQSEDNDFVIDLGGF